MAKRGNGEGSITKRKDGRWQGQVTTGRDKEGKLIRKSVYGNSQSEVIKKIDLIKHELTTGEYVEPDKMIVKQWLDYWLKNYKKQYVKPRTYDSYESLSNHSIIPYIGKIQLQKLTTKDIQMLYSDKLDE